MRPLAFSILFLASFSGVACSSKSDVRRSTEPEYNSKADAAAYSTDAIFLGKDQKVRPANDFQFYFKNCTQSDERSYYSKTSYWCNDF